LSNHVSPLHITIIILSALISISISISQSYTARLITPLNSGEIKKTN